MVCICSLAQILIQRVLRGEFRLQEALNTAVLKEARGDIKQAVLDIEVCRRQSEFCVTCFE